MSDISQETHQALLDKAVRDAVEATDKALAAKTEENATLSAQVDELSTKVESLTADNTRLNSELDAAQVAKKTADDKAAQLEKDLADKDAAAAKAEVATKRTEQVRNLKLFTDEYVQERASAWADLSEEAWTERLDEWKTLKPEGAPAASTDAASAMTGTSGGLTTTPAGDEKPKSARRAALGLVN
jgi:chromosome segregation ATPase